MRYDTYADHMLRAFQTGDARETIAAFQLKRPPNFRGRQVAVASGLPPTPRASS
jgi:hypothetical protein